MRRRITYGDQPAAKRVKRPIQRVAKSMVRYKQPSTFNRCVIATTVTDTIDLTGTDGYYGYGFSPSKLWVNGVSGFSYPTSVINIWDLARVVKVEITIAANSNSADFSSGTTILIPYAYDCFDPNDNNAPVSLTEVQQNSTCQMFRLDKVRTRTIYPLVQNANVVDVGIGRRTRFLNSAVDNPMNGYKLVIDQPAAHAATITEVRVNFKIFLEVRSSV